MSPPKKKPGAGARPTTAKSTARPTTARSGATSATKADPQQSGGGPLGVSAETGNLSPDSPDTPELSTGRPSAKEPNAQAPGIKEPGAGDAGARDADARETGGGVRDAGAREPGAREPGAREPGVKRPTARRPGARGAGAKRPNANGPGIKGPGAKGKAKGTAKATPTPAVVVGAISPLTRLAGALAVLCAALLLLQPAFPLVREAGRGLGGAHNLWDFVVPLPAAAVIGTAGALCLLGRLPRLGLAALIAAGGYGLGELVRTAALLDTSAHSSIDLPLPEGLVRSFRYAAGPGLVLRLVALGGLSVVLVLAVLAWRRTVMDDDGSFDPLRPTFGALGFAGALVGFAAVAFPPAFPVPGGLTITVPSLFDRSGLDLLGGWLLVGAVTAAAVGAATVRPRLAVVGMFGGLAAMFGTAGLGNVLLIVRSTALELDTGTAFQLAAAVVFTTLAVAAWRVTRQPAGEQD